MALVIDSAEALNAELDEMANRQFDTREFRDLLDLPLTMGRARILISNMAHYVCNRRDCWGYVQGAAPLDIKRLIWEHEQEELVLDPRAGTDHYTLSTREAAVVGLTAADIESTPPVPGAQAAMWAWVNLAKSRTWLEAVAASSVLERRNSSEIIRGGGLSYRTRRKMIDELGIEESRLINQTVHVAADVEHANLLNVVIERYAQSAEAREAILRGARESFVIDCAFRGAVAQAMARVD